jgi:hypothetical protein
MDLQPSTFEHRVYIVHVLGELKKNWTDWLKGEIENPNERRNITKITITVPDQSALRGILNKLWDLNLTLISVNLKNDQEKTYNLENNFGGSK